MLRECLTCNGTDEALLKGGMENERTFLLASWFRCIKLPVDVMEEDHPFHELFLTEGLEHLFVSSADGSNHDPLESETSQKELWSSMAALIALEYEKKPDAALKQVAKLLDAMDVLDQRWNQLVLDRDRALEKDGPDARKLPKLARAIRAVEEEKKALLDTFAKASRLELKKRPADGEAAPGGAADGPEQAD